MLYLCTCFTGTCVPHTFIHTFFFLRTLTHEFWRCVGIFALFFSPYVLCRGTIAATDAVRAARSGAEDAEPPEPAAPAHLRRRRERRLGEGGRAGPLHVPGGHSLRGRVRHAPAAMESSVMAWERRWFDSCVSGTMIL